MGEENRLAYMMKAYNIVVCLTITKNPPPPPKQQCSHVISNID